MAEGKNSFILYADDIHTVEQLTDGEAGQLFKTILRYVNDMDPVPDERIVALAFEPIKQRLKRDLKNWEEIRAKRAEAGRAGAQKKAEQTEAKSANADTCQQDEANQAVSDSVSVSVSVSDKREISDPPAADLQNSNLFRKPNIPTIEKVREVFAHKGATREMADSFFKKHDGTGWYLNGSPIVNFSALADRFIQNWKNNDAKNPQKAEIPTGPVLKKLI